jgi:uncharacterized protein
MQGTRVLVAALVAAAVVALLAGPALLRTTAPALEISAPQLPADGASSAIVSWRGDAGDGVQFRLLAHPPGTTFEKLDRHRGMLHAGVTPGSAVIEAEADGKSAQARVELQPQYGDSERDGTPDFLRLTGADAHAFRQWFTFLAEDEYFRAPTERLAEVNDCAALLRFAYRETLRGHDATWANGLGLKRLATSPSVTKYRYPVTPLGAALFRVRGGTFRESDLKDGTFAEFADANTLMSLNSHLMTRDVMGARPGDLLFFRQPQQQSPFHAMIFVGTSHFEGGSESYVVYHTGPEGSNKGEVRRLTLAQLAAHPEPRWRPLPSNPAFLGVYRWNILREANP